MPQIYLYAEKNLAVTAVMGYSGYSQTKKNFGDKPFDFLEISYC